MRFSWTTAALMAIGVASAAKDDDSTSTSSAPACIATSVSSGAYFDLRPDIARHDGESKSKYGVTKDYHARGYDYGKNFTLNICGPVLEPVKDVAGIDKSEWANVSAYYTYHDKVYSIGSTSLDLRSRGRKLVLRYVDGSPCGGSKSNKSRRDLRTNYDSVDRHPHEVTTLDSDDSKSDKKKRRKSTIISFLCDREPTSTQAAFSFVGTDPDECAYFFEARSVHACAQAEPHKPGSVGPGSVFGLILVIAVLVYAIGGVCYNRTVTHARGWRQLPNYSLWAGIWGFISDMFVILASSCMRFLPSRRGYRSLNQNFSTRSRNNADAENRLIDQLDEEWDD